MAGAQSIHIGIDLDNTLISYDGLFLDLAARRNFVPAGWSGSKKEIRDRIRLLPDGELEWQRLQAHAYGPAIGGARLADGALEFVRAARARGALLSIVSHKSAFSNLGESGVNLRDSALTWLRRSGVIGADRVPQERVYFEDTRAAKIARIKALQCTHFIDDLEEVFLDPEFPSGVQRLLLSATPPAGAANCRTFSSFAQITDALGAI